MNKINPKFLCLCSCLMLLFFLSCNEEKFNFEPDNGALISNHEISTTRIVNLAGYGEVVANGDTLTSTVVSFPNGPNPNQIPETEYFPVDGSLGKFWFIPQNLYDTEGRLRLQLNAGQNIGVKLELTNSNSDPTDYYLIPTTIIEDQPDVVSIKRAVTPPAQPNHFKIRVVNLSGRIKSPIFNSNGAQEDLTGNVSLAYANGSLVSGQTSNISNITKASEYIELPYGTYQFKVLMEDGRQMPSLGSELSETTIIDPPTSITPVGFKRLSNITYAPIQTYQPGGIYTILVAPQPFKYLINELDETSSTYQNSFQIINDNTVVANNSYFKLQAVNAVGSASLSFRIDGKAFGNGPLSFGAASEYAIFNHGTHKVEVVNASGQVIATTDQVLRPAQNYTAWAYPDASGKVQLLILANDLSGASFTGQAQEDGTFSHYQYRQFFHTRFLNLSPDNPFITFTQNNGLSAAQNNDYSYAGVNLQPGLPILTRPYVTKSYNQASFQWMAYRSKPNVVPGVWAQDIAPLEGDDLIANKALYDKPGREMPVHEPGVYTVALVGRSGAEVIPAEKAKMIIIKHNK